MIPTFEDWLKTRKRGIMRDLAQDVSIDKAWPTGQGLAAYRSYLRQRSACDEAFKALIRAWGQYQKQYFPPEKSY
jgi:hypothetical protein